MDAKFYIQCKEIIVFFYLILDTNPDFQHHGIDYASNYSDEVEHIPGIFEKVLSIVEQNESM